MTTLPQTPMRLQRPNAAGTIMVPGSGGGMMPPSPLMQPAQPTITPGDLWRIVRANLWIILSLLVLSLVGGYFVNGYLDRYHRKFEAIGLIKVEPGMTTSNPLTGVGAGDNNLNNISLELRTQLQLLRHDSLYSDVFLNSESRIKNTSWFAQFNNNVQEAKKALAEEIESAVIPDSRLISVSMSYSVPKDCSDIVYDVIQQHLRNQRRETQNDQIKRLSLLNEMLGRYDNRLNELAREQRERQIRLNMDGMGTSGKLGIKEMNMTARVGQQVELTMKGQMLRAQIDTMKKQNERGDIPASIRLEVDKDPLIVDMERQLGAMELVPPDPATAGHPNTIRTMAAITALRNRLETIRSQKVASAMVAATEALETEIAANEQALKTITEAVEKSNAELSRLNNDLSVYLSNQDEEKLLREQKKEVKESLDLLRATSGQQELATVSWAQQPQTPEVPSFPQLKFTLAAALAIGLALSAAIAFLREVTDTTIRSPRDIHRIGQMTFLGMVPHESDDPQAAGARLPLVIFDAPTSMMADQLRQVRTRLQYAASLDTTRSILVTSPGPDDGKTVLACNLAAGLALNGRRILIVDADFRRPALHKIFELDNARGFGDVLQDVNLFDDCVRPTQVPNLSVLPVGSKPGNATELLESQLFVDFIERALDDYDHVIFDCGSIMVVSEAIAMAPRVDGVVTVVKARSNSRGLLQRMRDTLRQLKAEHLGIILNGVRAQGGGYYGRNIKTYYAYQDER
jgi:capsular exopolysaccharide synthesis family protein